MRLQLTINVLTIHTDILLMKINDFISKLWYKPTNMRHHAGTSAVVGPAIIQGWGTDICPCEAVPCGIPEAVSRGLFTSSFHQKPSESIRKLFRDVA